MSAAWAQLETRVINDEFPLQRCIGSSDHSGVFLTQSSKYAPSQLALKLVRGDPSSSPEVEALLSRWRAAIGLSHPHLIRIFEASECQLDGERYVYALMEHAEQNLAQPLEQRALTEAEAREMLEPTLSALAYLHGHRFVQGALKPSSVLVVGDELKLASDSVRAFGEGASEAEDVRALAVTLCEALTRLQPSGLDDSGAIELPPELPAAFREIIARCLSRNPSDRPRVSDLQAWLRGDTSPAAPSSAAPVASVAPATRLVIRVELPSDEEAGARDPQPSGRRALALVAAVVVVVALGWIGYRAFMADRPSSESSVEEVVRNAPPPQPVPAEPAPAATPARSTSPAETEAARAPSAAASASAPPASTRTAAAPPAVAPTADASAGWAPTTRVNEVVPEVPRSALQTIRGTVRVSIRVIVDKDGNVLAATPDDPGPSRYFERLSLDASKKWTFAPADSADQRLMLVRFAYTRSGVTANAKPL